MTDDFLDALHPCALCRLRSQRVLIRVDVRRIFGACDIADDDGILRCESHHQQRSDGAFVGLGVFVGRGDCRERSRQSRYARDRPVAQRAMLRKGMQHIVF